MALERCRHLGHDFHRDDTGKQFVAHQNNPRGPVFLTCCWCEKKAEMEGYAKATNEPPLSSFLPDQEHGPFLPVPL